MNGGVVLPFRRPAPKAAQVSKARRGLAIALEARPGAVCIVIGETELWVEPEQARTLGRDLVELAAYAEVPRGG